MLQERLLKKELENKKNSVQEDSFNKVVEKVDFKNNSKNSVCNDANSQKLEQKILYTLKNTLSKEQKNYNMDGLQDKISNSIIAKISEIFKDNVFDVSRKELEQKILDTLEKILSREQKNYNIDDLQDKISQILQNHLENFINDLPNKISGNLVPTKISQLSSNISECKPIYNDVEKADCNKLFEDIKKTFDFNNVANLTMQIDENLKSKIKSDLTLIHNSMKKIHFISTEIYQNKLYHDDSPNEGSTIYFQKSNEQMANVELHEAKFKESLQNLIKQLLDGQGAAEYDSSSKIFEIREEFSKDQLKIEGISNQVIKYCYDDCSSKIDDFNMLGLCVYIGKEIFLDNE